MSTLATLVAIIHSALVVFMIVVPLRDSPVPQLLSHIVVAIGLLSHWVMRTDVCALTYIEAMLRGVKPEKSFIFSVVGPVFNVSDALTRRVVFWGTVALAMVSAWRLSKKLSALCKSVRS